VTAPTRTPLAAYSLTLRVDVANVPGLLGRLASAIGEQGASIEGMSVAQQPLEVGGVRVDDIVVYCGDADHMAEVVAKVRAVEGVEVTSVTDRTFALHEGGKIEVVSKAPLATRDDLAMAYTPGVARVCTAVSLDPRLAHRYTIKRNTVAVVSDGSAVLGLGDIGPEGAMPVMEGKALLFKHFGGVDAFPICLDVKTADELVETVVRLAPTFGGINLEDISAPRCFEVEERLQALLDIPVFHDDQHGTAIVTLAALRNAVRVVDRNLEDLRVVIAGAGAAGVAICKILMSAGVQDIVVCDRKGAIFDGREEFDAPSKAWLATESNPRGAQGALGEVLRGADVFLGVSGPNLVSVDEIAAMAPKPIVFAMANPDPEIRPEGIREIAGVIATGRSDFPNQINNVLAFPGVFRGALDAQATRVTEHMKVAAAEAIAGCVADDELHPGFVIPSVFDTRVSPRVAAAVTLAAVADGVCRPGV
jgi:malate dehydrogenase (oxaloacetate-decarboxylating)